MISLLTLWFLCNLTYGQAPPAKTFPLEERFRTPQVEKMVSDAFKKLNTARELSELSDRERSMAAFYLNRFLPWKLTQPENASEISPTVRSLMDTLSRSQKMNSPGASAILSYWFQGLKALAEGDYAPSARINAAIALGQLKLRQYDATRSAAPVPYTSALPVLTSLYENESNPDGVRAAALHGLAEYTKFGFVSMPGDAKAKLASLMKALLNDAPPEGRSAAAHAYLQRYAVDILGSLLPKQDTSLATQLVSISSTVERPDIIALYSASTLGQLDQTLAGSAPEPSTILSNWSKRIFATFESEIARLEALERPSPASPQPPTPDTFLGRKQDARANSANMMNGMMDEMDMMGMDEMDGMDMMEMDDMDMMDMDMMGMGMGMGMGMMPAAKPQPPEVSLSRRLINDVIQQLMLGAVGARTGGIPKTPSGLLTAAPEDKRAAIEEWVAQIEPVVVAINDPALDDRDKWLEALAAQRIVMAPLAGVEIEVEEAPEEDVFPDLPFMMGVPARGLEEEPPAGLPGM